MLKNDFYRASQFFGNFRVVHKLFEYVREHRYYWKIDKKFLLMKFLARFIAIRERAGIPQLPTREILSKAGSTSPIQMADSIEFMLETLSRDGYYRGLRLRKAMVEGFLKYAFSHPCYADRNNTGRPIYLAPTITESCSEMPFRVASYIRDQEECPLIHQLINDPLVLAIAEAYLGNTPIYHKSELLWSFPHQPSSGDCYTHFFHCDINDYRNVKFFFYLTDVDEASGPHLYIKGSHKKRPLIEQFQGGGTSALYDQKLLKLYGKEMVQVVTGPAGFGFIGDPYTFHRGSDTRARARLLLQIEFTISKYRCWYYNR